jgi:hypothetical protein
MKVMYSVQDSYSEANARTLNVDISQVVVHDFEKDLSLQMKYRFLHVTDTGDLVPIYNSAQQVTASAAEVSIQFKGHRGSGFEHC